MRPAISIDFGAAYTKIAFRSGTNEHSQLLSHEKLRLDEDHICIPTIVAWRETDDRWIFGADAADITSGNGIHVYRNWKPVLFAPPGDVLDPESSIGRLFYYNLEGSDNDWPPIKKLAVKYFEWLIEVMLPSLVDPDELKNSVIRISVPEFSGENVYRYQMEEVLIEAGWSNPWIFSEAEPLTNLVGALSQGKNALVEQDGTIQPDVNTIFSGSGLVNYIDKIAHQSVEEPFNMLLIDIGAYTTDFSIVTIDGRQSDADLPPLESHSEPYGIELLDNLVKHGLTKEKADIMSGLSATEREIFRRTLYSDARSWTLNNTTIGEGDDRIIIDKCIKGLATRISNEIDAFLDFLSISHINEAVLTGGGNNIPRFAMALAERLILKGVETFHSTSLPQNNLTRTIQLNHRVSRASSALGGASVLFGDE